MAAAESSVSPTSPTNRQGNTAYKVKSQFLFRHTQDSHAHATPTQHPPTPLPPLHRLLHTASSSPAQNHAQSLVQSPKLFNYWDYFCSPSPTFPASPPASPAPLSPLEDTHRTTTLSPFSPFSPLSPSPLAYTLHKLPEKLCWSRPSHPSHPHTHAHRVSPHAHTTLRRQSAHSSTEGLDLSLRAPPTTGSWHAHIAATSLPHHTYSRLHHHHRHHRPLQMQGGEGPIMLSEPPRKRPHPDVFSNIVPTASKKRLHLDPTDRGGNEYKNKPISQWKYMDVVNFFMDGWISNLDCNFSDISGVEGPELARLPREKFRQLSSKHGDKLFKEVQRRVMLERENPIPSHPHPANLSTSPTTHPTSPSRPSTSIYPPPYILTHNHLQPSVICDAQAPYELRIEPPPHPPQQPHQPPLRLPRGQARGGRYDLTPTAALKSTPPPLMALDPGGREGREGEVNIRQGGGGVSQEAGQRSTEEVKVEPPKKRGPGRPKKPENELKKKKKRTGRLWEFIRNLLFNPETCPSMVKWENAEEGLFRFIDGEKVAKRWGDRKQNKDMNYEKLSRAMRYYYKTHIFEAVIGRRLVYKFGHKATGWRTSTPNYFPEHDPHLNSSPPREPQPPPQPQPPPPPQIHFPDTTTPLPHPHTDHKPHYIHHTDNFSSTLLPPQITICSDTSTASTSQPTPQPHHPHHHTHTLTMHHHHHNA